MKDLTKVGGKNASLGEMINTLTPLGISVPDGFAITVDAFCEFLSVNSLSFAVQAELNKLERKSLNNLSEVGRRCRELVMKSIFPQDAEKAIRKAYNELIEKGQSNSVAVRSSATAEDSPTASCGAA